MTRLLACYSLGGITNVVVFYLMKDWKLVLVFYYILLYILVSIPLYLYV